MIFQLVRTMNMSYETALDLPIDKAIFYLALYDELTPKKL